MDEKAVENAGLAPLMADIARVRAIGDKTEFARFMGSTYDKFGIALFAGGPYADPDDPTMNTLWFGQGGIGLPEKDYYFNPQFAKQRAAYQDYIERTMKALGDPAPAAAASEIMAFETYVAALSWDAALRRDIAKINNPMSTAELISYAPGIDWNAYFAGANVPEQKRIIVNENTAIRDLAALYAKTPLETLKRWQEFHVADQAAGFLPKRWSTASSPSPARCRASPSSARGGSARSTWSTARSASWSARATSGVLPADQQYVIGVQADRQGQDPYCWRARRPTRR